MAANPTCQSRPEGWRPAERFLARWQPSGAPCRQDAAGVGVAAALPIALREHQDVLAEGREILAAQGTAVGRGLAVLGRADLPPAGVFRCARYCRSVEHRDQRIVAETDRHRITGILHLPRD